MADTPFGLSFGSPNRYMGQSDISKAIKTGLAAYGMQKSGLTAWLDGLSKAKQPNIPGSIVPNTAIADQGQLPVPPKVPENMDMGPMMSTSNEPVAPVAPAPSAAAPAPEQTPAPYVEKQETTAPQDLGKQWLSGNVSSYTPDLVDPQASRDIPVPFDGSANQFASNDYKNSPGYGTLKKVASAFLGMA